MIRIMKLDTIYNIIRCKGSTAMLAALTLLTACSDDLTNGSGGINSGKPFELQAQIQQENVTRANDNGFADGDQMVCLW